ncbi:MAG: DNA polymerase III subunit delta, partial [Aestuariivirga sp.]
EDADETCLNFLEPAFRYATLGNFVVVLCSVLGKTSKLRSAAEESNLFACLAVYEEVEAKLRARIRKLLMDRGLSWGTDAEEEFYSAVGDNRALVTGEAKKLALYAHGKTEISVDDVKAICGDTAEFYADDLTDAILAGDLELTDHVSTSMGSELRSFFPLFQLHIAKLQTLAMDMERGMNADSAVRGAKPPIFFKRKPAVMDQLKRISLQNLIDIQASVQETTLLSRKNADLSDAINSRALLALARQCRARN